MGGNYAVTAKKDGEYLPKTEEVTLNASEVKQQDIKLPWKFQLRNDYFYGVHFVNDQVGWTVGKDGRILKNN